MNTLQHMRVVLAIAEHGSLTAAANHLDTSLPTVVRILAATEQHLGVRLFDRTTRRIRITDEGALYVESSRRILGELSDLEDVLRDRQTEPAGTLTITAPLLFGRLHVSPVVNAFLLRYPKISVKLFLIDRVVDLVEEGIDLAIRIGAASHVDLVVTPLGHVRRCVCATPAFLAAHAHIETLSDLADIPFIQSLGLMHSNQISFGVASDDRPVTLSNIRLSTNHADVAIAGCLDGLGASLFLSYQVQDLVATGQLRIILEKYEPAPLPVALVYSPSRRLSARTRTFIAWAKQHLGERINLL
jgi:DNA-binding transcriptional LysR family regulator